MKPEITNNFIRATKPYLSILILNFVAIWPPAFAGEVRLTSIEKGTNGVAIEWTNSTPGSAFTVQVNNSLSPGGWKNATSRYRWPIPGARWVEALPPATRARFYRVQSEVPAVPNRGNLVKSSLIRSISLSQVRQLLAFVGYTNSYPIQVPLREYKLNYESVDPYGFSITNSGVLFVPQGLTNALPLLSYHHGTFLERFSASQDTGALDPDRFNYTEALDAMSFATGGYVTVLPDYLGRGDSPGFQAYLHARTEAADVVDMLRAARTFCASNGIQLNAQLFLAGYSQGGHVTMAAHREIESYHSNEFTVTASAPMAGPYDLGDTSLDYVLASTNYAGSAFVAQIFAAYLPIYHLADTLEELFGAPFNKTVAPLLDGNHSFDVVQAVCPLNTFTILRADFLESLRHNPMDPFRLAMRDNNLYEWTPRAPMRMYHCKGDTIVPYANAEVAYQSFTNRGACCVVVVDPGPAGTDHGRCWRFVIPDAKRWFDSLKL